MGSVYHHEGKEEEDIRRRRRMGLLHQHEREEVEEGKKERDIGWIQYTNMKERRKKEGDKGFSQYMKTKREGRRHALYRAQEIDVINININININLSVEQNWSELNALCCTPYNTTPAQSEILLWDLRDYTTLHTHLSDWRGGHRWGPLRARFAGILLPHPLPCPRTPRNTIQWYWYRYCHWRWFQLRWRPLVPWRRRGYQYPHPLSPPRLISRQRQSC